MFETDFMKNLNEAIKKIQPKLEKRLNEPLGFITANEYGEWLNEELGFYFYRPNPYGNQIGFASTGVHPQLTEIPCLFIGANMRNLNWNPTPEDYINYTAFQLNKSIVIDFSIDEMEESHA